MLTSSSWVLQACITHKSTTVDSNKLKFNHFLAPALTFLQKSGKNYTNFTLKIVINLTVVVSAGHLVRVEPLTDIHESNTPQGWHWRDV